MQNGHGDHSQPFSEHVRELRHRLFVAVGALMLASSAGYMINQRLLHFITQPLHGPLYYTTPTGGFNAIVKISLMFGMVVAVPVFIYEIFRFLSPAFKYRLSAFKIIISATLFALLGAAFAYYLSLPAALRFLTDIGGKELQSLITVNEYLSFVFAYIVGFALLFELPLIMLLINRIKPQKPSDLMKIQRWVILFSFIVAAILTPTPDPINQCIMALPIILLFQCSIVMIWIVNRKNKAFAHESVPAVSTEAVVENVPEAVAPAPQATPMPNNPIAGPAPSAYSAAAYSASATPADDNTQAPSGYNPGSEPRLIMDIFRPSQQTAAE